MRYSFYVSWYIMIYTNLVILGDTQSEHDTKSNLKNSTLTALLAT